VIIHRHDDGSEGFEYELGDRVIVNRTIHGGWFDYGPTRAEYCTVKRRNSRSNRSSHWRTDSLEIHYSDEWGWATCSPWGIDPHPETYDKASVILIGKDDSNDPSI
jgi:hypothetical protein